MRWLRFWQRSRRDAELAAELESYLDHQTQEGIAAGLTPGDARAAARRKLGNATRVREDVYERNTVTFVQSIWQDVAHAARLLRMNPGFACAAIVTLALGVGANTAIFQLIDAVRLRNLPVEAPEELAVIRIAGGNRGMGLNPSRYGGPTRPVWEEIRRDHPAFSGVFAWDLSDGAIGRGSELQRVTVMRVSGELFPVLRVRPAQGRLIAPPDETSCPAMVAVLSHAYWQHALGSRELAGMSLLVNGQPMAVVGVTPPSFLGLAVGDAFDIAIPFCTPSQLRRDVFGTIVMGRLANGWTLARASSALDAASPRIFDATAITGYSADTVERYRAFRLEAADASGGVSWLRSTYDTSLSLLLAITGLVLLIACANLANLMLARGSVREREMAVRLSLGASRRRLVRQLVVESAVLAAVGALLGVVLARLFSRVLVRSISTESAEVTLPIATDWRILSFAVGVAALTCIIFGLVPAFRTTQASPTAALKAGGRGIAGSRGRFVLQRLLVVTQIAVSLVLLVGALLFVRSFANLAFIDAGLRQEGIVIARIGLPQVNEGPRERHAQFQRDLLESLRALPGVRNAATTTNVPLLGGSWTHAVRLGDITDSSKFTWVSSGYFATMGMSLLDGRDFGAADTPASRPVAIVNQTFVKRFLNGAPPLGRLFQTVAEPDFPAADFEIVGVVADSKYSQIRDDTPPMAFAPGPQYPVIGPWAVVMIHADGPVAPMIAAVKQSVFSKYPEAVFNAGVFRTLVANGMVRERLMAMLAGFFGLLAALLAVVGLYGVVAYVVARRRNEIGIRLALGARPGQVLSLVMGEAAKMIAFGVACGLLVSIASTRSAGALLFGVTPHDPMTLILACALLGAIACGASFIPARRAARLDPTRALRE